MYHYVRWFSYYQLSKVNIVFMLDNYNENKICDELFIYDKLYAMLFWSFDWTNKNYINDR